MKRLFTILTLGSLLAAAAPQIVQTVFETEDTVIADAVFQRIAGDNAPALQDAINSLAAAGGGTLFLPAGEYSLEQTITVKTGVVLRGDNPLHPNKPGLVNPGTVLAIRHGVNQESGAPAIILQGGSGLRELVFWYPQQTLYDPIPYPWTVQFKTPGCNDSTAIFNCRFVNSYKAIDYVTYGNELHTFRNTAICPLKIGIELDFTTDIGRLADLLVGIDAWLDSGLPDTPDRDKLPAIPLPEATGIVIHRSDWEYTRNLDFRGLAIGMRFCKGPHGATNTAIAHANFSRCGTALHFDELYMIGVNAFDCTFEAVHPLVTTSLFTTTGQFNDCTFTGYQLPGEKSSLVFNGTGALSFRHCGFRNLSAEITAGQSQFSDCTSEGMEFVLSERAERLFVLGGRLADKAVIRKNADSRANVVVSPLPEDMKDIVLFSRDFAPHRTVSGFKSNNLLVVTDFGASTQNEDNGPAFRQAFAKAAELGGATVYMPAGVYRFQSDIVVPSGVELRGVADVPQHTYAGGSILQIEHNHGQEDADAFMGLQRGSGVRGVTLWYSRQSPSAPVPYPWAIRALGQDCWVVDVSAGGVWQFIDLGFCDTTGHLVNYAAGGCFRRGIRVANSRRGDVIDVHLNPHYYERHPRYLSIGTKGRFEMGKFIDYQRSHLEGFVYENVKDEINVGNFIFAAIHGLRVSGDSQMRLLMHGSDTTNSCVTLECDSPAANLDFALAQLTPFGSKQVAGIVTTPTFAGKATFVGSQYWIGRDTALLQGPGTVVIDQMFSLCGPIIVNNGRAVLAAPHFVNALPRHIVAGAKAADVQLVGPVALRGMFNATAESPERYRAFATAGAATPVYAPEERNMPVTVQADFESPSRFKPDQVSTAGGIVDMPAVTCRLAERQDAHSGTHAVMIQGHSGMTGHQYSYFKLLDGPFLIRPDTVLSYWFKPLNPASRHAGLDIGFRQGSPMRDRQIMDTTGNITHPVVPRGTVNEWTQFVIKLGDAGLSGQVIDHIAFAFDSNLPNQDVAVMVDDVSLSSPLPFKAFDVDFRLENGKLVIVNPTPLKMRFTTNGINPSDESPIYVEPVVLPGGVADIRAAFVGPDGKLIPYVLNRSLGGR